MALPYDYFGVNDEVKMVRISSYGGAYIISTSVLRCLWRRIVFTEPLSTKGVLEAQLSSPPPLLATSLIPPTSQVKELGFYSKESVNVLKHINRVA